MTSGASPSLGLRLTLTRRALLLVMDHDTWPFEVRNVYLSQCCRPTISLDNILFSINEKTSTLTAQQIPQAPNGTTLPLIANVSIVPNNINLNGSFAGAELIISEPTEQFPNSLIYVSNRNLGPEFDPCGDSIAILQFSKGSSTSLTISVTTSSGTCSKHKGMVKAHARQLPVHRAPHLAIGLRLFPRILTLSRTSALTTFRTLTRHAPHLAIGL